MVHLLVVLLVQIGQIVFDQVVFTVVLLMMILLQAASLVQLRAGRRFRRLLLEHAVAFVAANLRVGASQNTTRRPTRGWWSLRATTTTTAAACLGCGIHMDVVLVLIDVHVAHCCCVVGSGHLGVGEQRGRSTVTGAGPLIGGGRRTGAGVLMVGEGVTVADGAGLRASNGRRHTEHRSLGDGVRVDLGTDLGNVAQQIAILGGQETGQGLPVDDMPVVLQIWFL